MKGAHQHKVKRVVVTSSIAAIIAQAPDFKTECFDESFWTNTEVAPAYPKSKTLAEKAAWDFVDSLPESEKFELATINPSFILGPSFIKCGFSSGEAI